MNALRLWSRILMIVVGILTAAVLASPLLEAMPSALGNRFDIGGDSVNIRPS